MTPDPHSARRSRLTRLIYLSIAAAVVTIALKTSAWALTGSVGMLSDAAESIVNLVAALVALVVVRWSTRPPDEQHAYGHEKADYLSAGVEGALILLAAVTIGYTAIDRLLNPAAIESVGLGVAISVGASIVNLVVGRILINAAREHDSIVLEADGRHLMTDVWTSAGVLLAVAAVAITGWETLDPLIALAVAINIIIAGAKLVRRSADGLLDRALSDPELETVNRTLETFASDTVQFHALRTRGASSRAFVSTHILFPATGRSNAATTSPSASNKPSATRSATQLSSPTSSHSKTPPPSPTPASTRPRRVPTQPQATGTRRREAIAAAAARRRQYAVMRYSEAHFKSAHRGTPAAEGSIGL